jgi:hypothetical protein
VEPVASPGLNLSDLELMHHYLEHTSKTLAEQSNHENKAHAWLKAVPDLALKRPCVAHSLLTLAALCFCHDRLREECNSIPADSDRPHRLSGSQLVFKTITQKLYAATVIIPCSLRCITASHCPIRGRS